MGAGSRCSPSPPPLSLSVCVAAVGARDTAWGNGHLLVGHVEGDTDRVTGVDLVLLQQRVRIDAPALGRCRGPHPRLCELDSVVRHAQREVAQRYHLCLPERAVLQDGGRPERGTLARQVPPCAHVAGLLRPTHVGRCWVGGGGGAPGVRDEADGVGTWWGAMGAWVRCGARWSALAAPGLLTWARRWWSRDTYLVMWEASCRLPKQQQIADIADMMECARRTRRYGVRRDRGRNRPSPRAPPAATAAPRLHTALASETAAAAAAATCQCLAAVQWWAGGQHRRGRRAARLEPCTVILV
jgi:hypothetical protein